MMTSIRFPDLTRLTKSKRSVSLHEDTIIFYYVRRLLCPVQYIIYTLDFEKGIF